MTVLSVITTPVEPPRPTPVDPASDVPVRCTSSKEAPVVLPVTTPCKVAPMSTRENRGPVPVAAAAMKKPRVTPVICVSRTTTEAALPALMPVETPLAALSPLSNT